MFLNTDALRRVYKNIIKLIKMKKVIFIVTIIAGLVVSCNTNSNKTSERVTSENVELNDTQKADVPFVTGENYFVKNTVEDKDLTLKITSQEDFDRYFGSATTMNKEGKPTLIDFSKQFVLAIIAESSRKEKTIVVQELKQSGSELTVSYKIEERDAERSFVSRSLLLLIVDNAYSGDVKFDKQ